MIDDTALRRRLAQALKKEMQRKGLSGLALARKVGIAQSTISRILEGNQTPSLSVLLAMLAGLGQTLGWLQMAGIETPCLARRCQICRKLRDANEPSCRACPGAGFTWVPWFGI